jgi:DUF4097 and DUF4098 domain-containing protein YvlB
VGAVGGSAQIRASFGQVEAERSGGDAIVEVQSGQTMVSDVTGRLQLEGSFGDASVRNVGGSAEVLVASGNVTVTGVRGDVVLGCEFGTVRARGIRGSLTVKGESSSVSAEEIGGAVDVQTTFGAVTLNGAGGDVTIRNDSGGISVRGLVGGALIGEHQLRTSFGDIRFAWPEGQAADITAEATFGSINSRLPLRIETSGSRQRAEGSIGSDGASLVLDADNGSVILEND